MKRTLNTLVSIISSILLGRVVNEEFRPRYPAKDRYSKTQRRAFYRLQQYRTRTEIE